MLPYQAMAMDYAASFQRQPHHSLHQHGGLLGAGGGGHGGVGPGGTSPGSAAAASIAAASAVAAAAGYSHSWFVPPQHNLGQHPATSNRELHNGHVHNSLLLFLFFF